MGRSAEAWQDQQSQRQQQENEELHFLLWSSLEALRGHVSEETFRQAEKELGFAQPHKAAQPPINHCTF